MAAMTLVGAEITILLRKSGEITFVIYTIARIAAQVYTTKRLINR